MMPMMLLSPERKGKEKYAFCKAPEAMAIFSFEVLIGHMEVTGRGDSGAQPGNPTAEQFLQGLSVGK